MRQKFLLPLYAVAIFALIPASCLACEYPVQPAFAELITHDHNVAIVRVVSAELYSSDHREDLVIAHVRRVETLRGAPYDIRTIRYNNDECGGHRLDVGQYLLLVSDSNGNDFDLVRGANSVLSLWPFTYFPPEWWAQMGSTEEKSGSSMPELRRAIAGKGKLPKYEITEGLRRIQTLPPPPCDCSRQPQSNDTLKH